MDKQDSHINEDKSASKGIPKDQDTTGAVTQRHRYKLGEADGVRNPNGVGEPSTKTTLANQGGKKW